MKIYIGTSGYNYREWKGSFYPDDLPQKKWLPYYSGIFNTVEINNSFYVTVKPKTYQNWYLETPKDFNFVIKGHRYITQLKKLKNIEDSVSLFFENAKPLQEKLKVVLWQFPANFSYSVEHFERLKYFLEILPQNIKHAFEFREKGWFVEKVEKLLGKNNSTLVISQSSKFPEIELPGNKLVYIRFHGPKGLYSSGYSKSELLNWSKKINKYSKDKEVFAFFNNDNGGYATKNALELKNMF
ncbi:MAG TPA: DUF72 domain-containing protein [Patescibacteria group bacterium]|nr:DUF72 domain-containing protein [Patescibacteria group bacterium]